MNLKQKKKIAAKIFKVGIGRIVFDPERLNEIKECITKQDIRDLFSEGAIKIKEKYGRKKILKRKKRKAGSIKKRIFDRKKEYIIKIRRLRKYLSSLKEKNKISAENYKRLRVYIKVGQIDSIKKIDEFLKEKK